MRFITGIIVGFSLAIGSMAYAGIITHVAAYEIGKHNGKNEAKEDCVCPKK